MFTWTESVLVVLLIVAVCAWIGGLWYRRNEKKEDKKRVLAEVAGDLKVAKLRHLAKIVMDVQVDDWDGLYRNVRALYERLQEPGQLLGMLDDNFKWQLAERVGMPEWRDLITAAIGKPVTRAPAKKKT